MTISTLVKLISFYFAHTIGFSMYVNINELPECGEVYTEYNVHYFEAEANYELVLTDYVKEGDDSRRRVTNKIYTVATKEVTVRILKATESSHYVTLYTEDIVVTDEEY